MNEANRNLIVRIISAVGLGVPLLLSIFWSRPEGLLAWVLVAVVVGQGEFYWIALAEEPVWVRVVGIVCGLVLSLLLVYKPFPDAPLVALTASTLLFAIIELFAHKDIKTATSNAGLLLFGLLYVPLLITSLALLKRIPTDGAEWIVLAMATTWVADTGAYGVGRAIGKRKLYPAISPGKSIEGAIGGVFFSTVAGVVAKLWFLPILTWVDVVLICVPGATLGMIGDLVESMIKRGYGAKDSGKAIPGHGGLLDRIDALLFVVPYVYLYAQYVVLARGGR
ncbi:MAG: phosphatidate cytidylyltransferase [Proteobacteria bacterium]|nr:MAG: phosphatidate cytidylyltransferase [Pseudomonadota bacterium]PIE17128.1 MAG: phosphatidate cytidylyltransferase [Pseudomonadota bacterium]